MMRKDDWIFVAKWVSGLFSLFVGLYLLLILAAHSLDYVERCEKAGGYVDRGYRCVQKVEGF